MKLALLLNTINPKIGGVLIRGKKGTAKSTAVRSLATLLPEVTVLQGCPYSCPPEGRQGLCQWCQSGANDNPPVKRLVRIVDLPVGATEDRLVGSLDIEQAIKTGDRSFEPGLIAATHRGILYIDEVNLLNDHLVDVLLDAAAMGRNYVEREGISVAHAAEFILVGTMNPEEGDLRPQLLDRFGLAVEVEGTLTAEERREVVRRRISYEANPFRFMARWRKEEERERRRLLRSQRLLPRVSTSDDILTLITDICAEFQVDGMRGDIVMYKTAGTIAAYQGRTEVTVEDVRQAARLALLHRQRRQPFQQPQMVTEQLDSMIDELQNQPSQREPSDQNNGDGDQGSDDGESHQPDQNSDPAQEPDLDESSGVPPRDETFEVGDPIPLKALQVQPPDRRARRSTGRRARTVSGSTTGRYVGAQPPLGPVADLALDATLRVAAPHQRQRRAEVPPGDSPPAILIEPWDLREKVRETKTGSLIIFVVDASGSMGAQRRMVAVKGAILSLLLDAYQRRDRVAMVAFRGTSAQLLLPPTGSVDLAQICLQEMPTGGRTPLSQGLLKALELVETETIKDKDVLPLLVLLSDGRANVGLPDTGRGDGGLSATPEFPAFSDVQAVASLVHQQHIPSVVIDTESGFIRLGLARPIAEAMGANYLQLEDLRPDNLAQAVRQELPGFDQIEGPGAVP
ncbi:MAG: hypothetical protein BZY88_05545 [SAR202 cluster bacterium Io17-Chloro-G9]|nr:MAG: hypothetical protein BZY88_05545 [SAR202 cluster bacterium Io17-Chloro-G9]